MLKIKKIFDNFTQNAILLNVDEKIDIKISISI